jgi:CRP-like cAMP-binding protein
LLVSGGFRLRSSLQTADGWPPPYCSVFFSDNYFGLPSFAPHTVSAEAVNDVIVMRYPGRQTERLLDENPRMAREFYDRALCELASSQRRTLLLGRLSATERVASFLIELAKRRDRRLALHLPMTRQDIADYLGLTIETVCRELSKFKRNGLIASTKPRARTDRILLCNRDALETICDPSAHDQYHRAPQPHRSDGDRV